MVRYFEGQDLLHWMHWTLNIVISTSINHLNCSPIIALSLDFILDASAKVFDRIWETEIISSEHHAKRGHNTQGSHFQVLPPEGGAFTREGKEVAKLPASPPQGKTQK